MAPVVATLTAAIAATNLAARDFSYHDNTVRFRGGTYNGTFTVTDFSISDGQDPSGWNMLGYVHQSKSIKSTNMYPEETADGFIFQAGRHATSQVADWWNTCVPPVHNTFNHNAGYLNFAFIGNLLLTINHGETVYIEGIGLAQGNDLNHRNWWFGGKSCLNKGGNKVECIGTNVAKNSGVSVIVLRGEGSGQQPNDVLIDSISDFC